MKEEKTELKKQVVGPGKVVVSEKIYVRQQAELASYRKSGKRNTVKEQNAEALAPFKSDLEKIKGMIQRPSLPQAAQEVNETEAENRSEAGLPSLEDFKEYLEACCESSDESDATGECWQQRNDKVRRNWLKRNEELKEELRQKVGVWN